MKKFFFCLLLLVFAKLAVAENYNRIGVSYTHDWYGEAEGWHGDLNSNGVGVTYNYGFDLLRNSSLFLETGADFNVGFASEKFTRISQDSKLKFTSTSIQIPVNIAYRLNFGKCSLQPFAGIGLRVNISGNMKTEFPASGILESQSYNIYDDDLFKDFKWRRVEGIWQAGVVFAVDRCFLSAQFSRSFTPTHRLIDIAPYTLVDSSGSSSKLPASFINKYRMELKVTLGITL